jgi:hypothetical protein
MKPTYAQKLDAYRALYTGDQDDRREYGKEMMKTILANVNDAFAKAVDHPTHKGKNFYVDLRISVVAIKKSVKSKIWVTQDCPSARFGHSVWKYHNDSGTIEYLWTIPGNKEYDAIIANTQNYLNQGGDKGTAKFCHMLYDGSLLALIQKENGYKKDGLIVTKDSNAG